MHDGGAISPEPIDDPQVGAALRGAVRNLASLEGYSGQIELDHLGANAVFTGIDVFEHAIFREGDEYSAPSTIYVELRRGQRSIRGSSFPARVKFKINQGVADLVDITVDTGGAEIN